MTLAADLEKLQRSKRDEIRTLHQTYLRTKRTLTRNVSPARLVRRNMGLTLAIAAAAGMLLAPRASASQMDGDRNGTGHSEAGGKGGWLRSLSGFKKLIGRFLPGVAEYIPDAEAPPAVKGESAEESTPARSSRKQSAMGGRILGLVMKELAALALSKVDFQKLMAEAMAYFTHRGGGGSGGGNEEEGNHPHVSVGDAGAFEGEGLG